MNPDVVFEYIINTLAFNMEHHLETLAELEGEVSRLDAGSRNTARLEDLLARLRKIRAAIRSRILDIQERLDSAPSSYVDDAYALIGYYVEAGAKGEERALRRASRYLDVAPDLEELEELVASARILLAKLSSRL
jgi:hypothetical protein